MTRPTIGMTRSSTTELTILPNAAPMMTPTARSMTLPLTANSLNSDMKLMGGLLVGASAPQPRERGPVGRYASRVSKNVHGASEQIQERRRARPWPQADSTPHQRA